jgi:hypothetical protein
VHLLYNNVPVYWAIRAGKDKDQADFTAKAYTVHVPPGGFAISPTLLP